MEVNAVIKVWLANLGAIFFNVVINARDAVNNIPASMPAISIEGLQAIKEVLGIAAIVLSMSYTIWQWYKARKKGKGGKDGVSSR